MNTKDIKNLDKEQILEMLGLETERSVASSVLWSIGLVGIGAIAGAVLALLLTPQTGRELRENVGRKLKSTAAQAANVTREKAGEAASHIEGS
jgi:hypothetical protein